MGNPGYLAPINLFAKILIWASAIGLYFIYLVLTDPSFDSDFVVFLVVMVVSHTIIGVGLLLRKRWGFFLFKGYLFVLYAGIPIGTYIAIRTLKYIRSHKLERYFS